MSDHQTVKPLLGEIGVGPALMVRSPAAASLPLAVAQNAAQAHSDPTVQRTEGRLHAVFEIAKPAYQRAVDIGDDAPQRCAGRASGFLADCVLELVLAFLPRPMFRAT